MQHLSGIVVPLVTPLSNRDTLDADALERLIDHVIGGGVSGIFILGSTGEAPSLSYRLRRQLITRSVAAVDGRVPVLVGVTDTAWVESVDLSRHAADAGADAVVLTTPYYFPTGQTELYDYTREIIDQFPLPTMIYNMPGLTKVWYEPETLKRLSDCENIIGVKDSSGDREYFGKICRLKRTRPDWSVFVGPESMLAEAHAAGGDGGVSGGANVDPKTFVDCWRALADGDSAKAAILARRIEAFGRIYDVGKYASKYIKATKSALSLCGLTSDLPADPFHPFLPPERQQVADVLDSLGLLDGRASDV